MAEIPVRIRFSTQNDKSIQSVIKRITTLGKRMNNLAKSTKKISKGLSSANNSVKKHSKAISGLNGKLSKLKTRLSSANRGLNKFRSNSKKTATATQGMSRNLRFSGFMFGFVGAAAGFALSKMTNFFKDTIAGSAATIGSIRKLVAVSGLDLKKINLGDQIEIGKANKIRDFVLTLSQTIPKSIAEIADTATQVAKAIPNARDIAPLTEAALKLQIIEDIKPEAAAINLAKAMKTFNLEGKDLERVLDALINVNADSSITLEALVKSMGFAGQSAQRLGLDIEDTLALIGLVNDRIGTTAGGPGRQLSRMFESISKESINWGGALQQLGISLLDSEGNNRKFMDSFKDMHAAFNKLGTDAEKTDFIFSIFTTAQGRRSFEALGNTAFEEIERAFESAGERGTAKAKFDFLRGNPDAQIQLLTNTVDELKLSFGSGLLPVIAQFNQILKSITADRELMIMIHDLGAAISEELISGLKIGVKLFKKFMKILKDNKRLIKFVAQGILALAGGLALLSVVGPLLGMIIGLTIIFQGLSAAIGVAGLLGSLSILHLSFLRLIGIIAVAGLIVVLLAKVFNDMDKPLLTTDDTINKIVGDLALLGVATLGGYKIGGPLGALAALNLTAVTLAITNLKSLIDSLTGNEEGSYNKYVADTDNDPTTNSGFDVWLKNRVDAINEFTKPLTDFIQTVKDWAASISAEFKQVKIGTLIIGGLTGLGEKLKEVLKIDDLIQLGRDMAEKLKEGMIDKISTFKTTIKEKFTSMFTGLGEKIKNALDIDAFIQMGKDMIGWIIQGLTAGLGAVGGSLLNGLLSLFNGEGNNSNVQGPQQPEQSGGSDFFSNITNSVDDFFSSVFGGKETEELNEVIADQVPLIESANDIVSSLNVNKGLLNKGVIALDSSYLTNKDQTDILTDSSGLMTTQVDSTRSSFITLQNAIEALAAKIARTNVSFKRDDDGNITGVKLSGGVSKQDISYLTTSFASGGIVKKPTSAIVGDVSGGEAIIPLRELPSLISRGLTNSSISNNSNITISPTIIIENGSDVNPDEIARIVSKKIASELSGKSQRLAF